MFEMILFLLTLSIFITNILAMKMNNILIKKYSNYNKHNSRYIRLLAILINLIVQVKFFDRLADVHTNTLLASICFISLIVLSSCLAVLFIIDINYFELPNELTILSGLSLIAFSILFYSGKSIITGVIIFIIYFLFAIFTNSFGMGDAKLAFGLGFGVNFSLLINFMFLSFLFASIFSIINIIKYKHKLKSEIAFGPFIIISFLLLI